MNPFRNRKEITSVRSKFANAVCDLIVEKYLGENCIENSAVSDELVEIYDYFDAEVRNIYEKINTEIPLFALYELLSFGPENWGMTEEEYNIVLDMTIKACEQYYLSKLNIN